MYIYIFPPRDLVNSAPPLSTSILSILSTMFVVRSSVARRVASRAFSTAKNPSVSSILLRNVFGVVYRGGSMCWFRFYHRLTFQCSYSATLLRTLCYLRYVLLYSEMILPLYCWVPVMTLLCRRYSSMSTLEEAVPGGW